MEEDRKERVDRELIELLNELRVVLPGAQVLFAFLLTLPFTGVFARLTSAQRDVYFASFLSTAAGAALLMAPSTNHRLRFRERDKEQMLFWFNRLTLAGTVFLALAIVGVVYVVTSVVFETPLAALVAGLVAGWFIVFWYAIPLYHRWRRGKL
jgi:hypothetical protein